jgi:hypothetical protein
LTDLFTLAGVDVPSTAPAYLDTPLGAALEIQQQKEREMEDTATDQKKERPIIFSTSMVCAILAGKKTQTRRIIKPQPEEGCEPVYDSHFPDTYDDVRVWRWKGTTQANYDDGMDWLVHRCPYGHPDDLLWVREAWALLIGSSQMGVDCATTDWERFVYRASNTNRTGWRPSIHMPKAAARIWLRITDVRVEQLQDITDCDAKAEGCRNWLHFADLWDAINDKKPGCAWLDNPWVWALTFETVETT